MGVWFSVWVEAYSGTLLSILEFLQFVFKLKDNLFLQVYTVNP